MELSRRESRRATALLFAACPTPHDLVTVMCRALSRDTLATSLFVMGCLQAPMVWLSSRGGRWAMVAAALVALGLGVATVGGGLWLRHRRRRREEAAVYSSVRYHGDATPTLTPLHSSMFTGNSKHRCMTCWWWLATAAGSCVALVFIHVHAAQMYHNCCNPFSPPTPPRRTLCSAAEQV